MAATSKEEECRGGCCSANALMDPWTRKNHSEATLPLRALIVKTPRYHQIRSNLHSAHLTVVVFAGVHWKLWIAGPCRNRKHCFESFSATPKDPQTLSEIGKPKLMGEDVNSDQNLGISAVRNARSKTPSTRSCVAALRSRKLALNTGGNNSRPFSNSAGMLYFQ